MIPPRGDGLVAPRAMTWHPRPRKRQRDRRRPTRFHISPHASPTLSLLHKTMLHLSYLSHAFAAPRSAARSADFQAAEKRCAVAYLGGGGGGMLLGYCLSRIREGRSERHVTSTNRT